MSKKKDAQIFCDHIDQLQNQTWLQANKKWWPKYVFHFTDVLNAQKILEDGEIKCRTKINSEGGIPLDIANQGIISDTAGNIQNSARFYFKPRSPMLYNTEGFRSVSDRNKGYCPMPIIFMLDSKKVLSRLDSQFSDGNLASASANLMNTSADFKRLPFHHIYHDEALNCDDATKRSIIYHRHAEVIVPSSLPLDNFLVKVVCRSKAEYDTLFEGLTLGTQMNNLNKVTHSVKYQLFYEQWNYVRTVEMSTELIIIEFNSARLLSQRTVTELKIEITDPTGQSATVYFVNKNNYEFKEKSLRINVANVPFNERYKVKITIDGFLAYKNDYSVATDLL